MYICILHSEYNICICIPFTSLYKIYMYYINIYNTYTHLHTMLNLVYVNIYTVYIHVSNIITIYT